MSIFNEPTFVRKPGKTTFDLSYENKMSMPIGRLVPNFIMECVPGDRVKLADSVFARTQALIAPAYQRYDISQHFFFVPYRLLWKNWENFITGGADGTFTAELPFFYYCTEQFVESSEAGEYKKVIDKSIGSVYDYLGYPVGHYHVDKGKVVIDSRPQLNMQDNEEVKFVNDSKLSAFRLEAYNLIFKSYYKDENIEMTIDDLLKYSLVDPRNSSIPDTNNFLAWLNDPNKEFAFDYEKDGSVTNSARVMACLYPRSWKKDYFTSALPWAQRGEEAVLESTLNVDLNVNRVNRYGRFVTVDGTTHTGNSNAQFSWNGTDRAQTYALDLPNTHVADMNYDPEGSLHAQGNLGTLFTLNDLRRMVSIQSWLERNARGGSRYVEQILAHFGVKVPDARLMRPEYLGGMKQPIQISSVEQNGQYSVDGVETPLGTLAGRGTSSNQGFAFDYTCLEHGIIMGIASVMPRASYQQGCSRFLTKMDKFDFYFPEFAHLGEQEIKNKELFFDFSTSSNRQTNSVDFGYQMRYAEYKANADEIHGDLRQSLDFWHDGRIFGSRPQLNQDFILCQPTNRPFAVTDRENELIVAEFGFSLSARRPMPRFGTPKLVG